MFFVFFYIAFFTHFFTKPDILSDIGIDSTSLFSAFEVSNLQDSNRRSQMLSLLHRMENVLKYTLSVILVVFPMLIRSIWEYYYGNSTS